MRQPWYSTRGVAVLAALLAGGAGCMLTAPLDELPAEPSPALGGAPDGGSSDGGSGDGGEGLPPDVTEGGTGGAPAPEGECQTNADCVKGSAGGLYRCRPSDHTCQALKTGECPIAEGDAADPNAIFFGSFANLSTVVLKDNPIVQAQLLALDDFSGQNVGGLPAEEAGSRRPLVLLVCNNSEDAVEAGLKHLIQDVEVPGILATLKPADLRRGFEKYAARDVFFLSPVSVTKTVVTENDGGLIWNMLGQPADFLPAYVKLLQHIEDFVRASSDYDVAPGEPVRVALITTQEAFDSELEDVIAPLLTFNGQFTSVNEAQGNYEGIEVPLEGADLAEIADKVVSFRPHIVVSMASGVMTQPVDGLIDRIESNWELEAQALPMYLLSPYNSGDLSSVQDLIKGSWDNAVEPYPERRFVGLAVASAEDSSLQNDYAVRLRNKFPDAYADTANYYDAFYYLSYATYAAGFDAPLTGKRIASGMQRLLAGDPFQPVPQQLPDVFAVLSNPEATIQLESTLGPPGFDPVTGNRPIDASVLCFDRTGDKVTLVRDVRRFDRALGKFRGSVPFCSSHLVP
jgi:hypothetical protein